MREKCREIAERQQASQRLVHDAGKAIDEPWFVVRYLVQRAIQVHTQSHGKPKLLHVPPIVEAALQVDRARNQDQHGKLRDEKRLFNIPVIWDADEFRIE